MCLAIPGRIVSLEGDEAIVDVGGVRARTSVALIEAPQPGEWVIVHTGYALSRIDEAAACALAAEINALIEEARA